MSETQIRALAAGDKAEWLRLWKDYLSFYEQELAPEVTETLFGRLLGEDGHFAFVAERDGALVGFVHALPHASTWSVAPACYLEDLYVDDAVRGNGSGRKLIEAVYSHADHLGCSNVYWHTHDDNARARLLYDRIGSLTQFVRYDRPKA